MPEFKFRVFTCFETFSTILRKAITTSSHDMNKTGIVSHRGMNLVLALLIEIEYVMAAEYSANLEKVRQ